MLRDVPFIVLLAVVLTALVGTVAAGCVAMQEAQVRLKAERRLTSCMEAAQDESDRHHCVVESAYYCKVNRLELSCGADRWWMHVTR